MPSHKVEFTEIEKYTIDHTGQIIDALASTFNRVADFLMPMSEEIEHLLKLVAVPRGYSIEMARSRAFAPFGYWPASKKHNRLEALFQYCAGFDLSSQVAKGGRQEGSFGVDFGFYYGPEIKGGGQGYFYFGVYNWNPGKFGINPDTAVYDRIKQQLPSAFEVEVYPDGGGLEISAQTSDASLVRDILPVYKEQVVTPFLKALP